MIKQIKAFTLVELIVVITILAILSTIGFVSYSGYLAGSRDTNRISQLKSISEGLNLHSTNKTLPTPDSTSIDILSGSIVIATQGLAGANVLETITYSTEGVDPKDKTYFTYYLTADKKYFQLMAFLEEESNLQSSIFDSVLAVDYEVRFPAVSGAKLGILTTALNVPLQESTGAISIDITSTTDILKSFLKDNYYISGTGAELSELGNIANKGGRGYGISFDGTKFTYTDLDNAGCIDIDSTSISYTTTQASTGSIVPTEIAQEWQNTDSNKACYYVQ